MGFKSFIIKADQLLGQPVAETGGAPPEKIPYARSETAMMSLAYIACASFIILGGRYVSSDFLGPELNAVNKLSSSSLTEMLLAFKYSCHPLYHSLLWLWVDIFGGGVEAFLRLPGLAFILISAYVIYAAGRRVLNSPGAGFLVMLLVIFNPVAITHFSQLFGYSLSILLASLVTVGGLLIAKGERLKGSILFCIGALLLPMTLTVGTWLNLTVVGFLLVHFLAQRKLKLNLILIGGLAIVGSLGGMVFLTLGFSGTPPPSTPGAVDGLGQWLVAVAAQLGLFVAAALIASRQTDIPEDDAAPDQTEIMRSHLWMLLFLSITASALYLLISQNPPATAICFSVPLAFSAIGCLKPRVLKVNKYFLVVLMAIMLNLLLWERGATMLTRQQILAETFHPNLIQQFPNGERIVSMAARSIRQMPNSPLSLRVFVDHRVHPTFAWYWKHTGGKMDALESMGPNEELALEAEHYMFLPKIAVGFSGQQMQTTLQQQLKCPVMLREIQGVGSLHIFHVLTPNPQDIHPVPEPGPSPISFAEITQ